MEGSGRGRTDSSPGKAGQGPLSKGALGELLLHSLPSWLASGKGNSPSFCSPTRLQSPSHGQLPLRRPGQKGG